MDLVVISPQTLAFAALATLALSALMSWLLVKVAPAYGLVDHANDTRKDHLGTPALVGGIAIFTALWAGLLAFTPDILGQNAAFAAAASLLIVVGAIDDRFDIRPSYKLAAQAAAALILVFIGKAALLSFGKIMPGMPAVALGIFSIPFTLIAIILLLNAWNMVDGLDGLASGLALVCLFWLCVAMLCLRLPSAAFVLPLCAAAAIAGFLPFNSSLFNKHHTPAFLGDAGSLLLGLLMAWLPLKLTQDTSFRVAPVVVAWVLALPVFDIVCVTFRRLAQKKNPMQADQTHLHHLFIRSGHDKSKVPALMMRLCFAYGGFGVLTWIWGLPQSLSLLLWVIALGAHMTLRRHLVRKALA